MSGSSGLITVPDVALAPSDIRHAAIDAMTHERGFDFTIVCTGNASQAEYWQQRLDAVKGSVVPAHATILVVDEDWAAGGAGNGLGTLYAYQKAADVARSKHGIDLEAALREGKSVALYHTAGKGTRLAPLPGSEANNKPGVKLAAMAKLADGTASNLSILEAVILQTGIYASSRKGRISVFWGDQVFVPSYMQGSAKEPLYTPTHHADIMCLLRPMPTAQQWEEEGLHKYGLIAVREDGNAAQVEKVTHETALELLQSFGDRFDVGTSLGSFSVTVDLMAALVDEFSAELGSKAGKLDTDPHFWMPLTLSKESYISIMKKKGVEEGMSDQHWERMAKFKAVFLGAQGEQGEDAAGLSTAGMLGTVHVGNECYWWDYGQLKLYHANHVRMLGKESQEGTFEDDDEAQQLRKFLGLVESSRQALCTIDPEAVSIDATSCLFGSVIGSGNVETSVLSNVHIGELRSKGSVLVNVSAKKAECNGSMLYNVFDDSEEGVRAGPGAVRADVILPDGKKLSMLTELTRHSGNDWKVKLDGNELSFEEVYKLNLSADTTAVLRQMESAHTAVAVTRGTTA